MDSRLPLVLLLGAALLGLGLLARFSLISLPRIREVKEETPKPTTLATSTSSTVATTSQQTEPSITSVNQNIVIGTTTIRVILADTAEKRTRGLSGYQSLGPTEGMLFIFPDIGRFSFWMSDVSFPIDIIWIGSDNKIIGVAQNALPQTQEKPTIFYDPPGPIRSVLEMRAGSYKKYNFATGTVVDLSQILQN